MASLRPPKQDKDRQRGINLYDQYERDMRLHKSLLQMGLVIFLVSSILQWVFNRFYADQVWGLAPLIGVGYGLWWVFVELQIINDLRKERASESLVQKILRAGDRPR